MEIISSSPRNIHEKELLHNPKASPTPPQTPKSQENNSYPTTFVEADTSNFKQVVQLLTGTSTKSAASATTIPPIKTTPQKKQGFKLHERRNSLKNGLMVNTFVPKQGQSFSSPKLHQAELLLSPSILDFPSLVLSPITPPLVGERNANCKSQSEVTNMPSLDGEEGIEEKAIAEKKFYLHHPSPRSKDVEPQLLTLFPLTSPRVSGSSSSSTTTTC